MTYRPNSDPLVQDSILTRVKDGMTVFDVMGDRVGTVSFIQFGDENPDVPGTEAVTPRGTDAPLNPFVENLAEAVVGPVGEIPNPLKARLLRVGYIKINTGLLKADCYAAADEIAAIDDESVTLNVAANQLIDPWAE